MVLYLVVWVAAHDIWLNEKSRNISKAKPLILYESKEN